MSYAAAYSNSLLQNSNLTDLEKLARLSDHVALAFPTNQTAYLGVMTPLIMGVRSGPWSPLDAHSVDKCAGWGRDPDDCPQNKLLGWIQDGGFHQDYQDSRNQAFHLWASVDAVGGAEGSALLAGREFTTYTGLQFVHEQVQGALGSIGASWQDFALTDRGMLLGHLLATESIQPEAVGDWLREELSKPFPLWNPAQRDVEYPLPGPVPPSWSRP